MTDLLKEAIADAKAVREVALANAKLALEEAFQPRIQSMIATKLSEEAESDEEMTEGEDEWYMEGEEGEETMEEGDDEEMPVEEGDDEEPAMEEAEEEMPVEEGDDEETPMEEGDDEETPMEEGDDEEIDEDLMEIIRQLEEELDSSEIGKGDNKQPSKYASDDSTTDKKEKLVQLVEEEEEEAPAVEEGDEEEADIKEILRALREEDEESEMEEGEDEEPAMEDEEKAEMEEKVNEAYAVIQFLREKLNEVNLLNSKLLFSNKLFRSYSLTESQKVTVIENFDRAGSLREVKLVYATLAESFKGRSMKTPKSTKKSSLKESFASKPQASTRPSKKILTESNQVADRFKKLAGLL
jgi:hypothetical protein